MPTPSPHRSGLATDLETHRTRLGKRLAAGLTERSLSVDADVSERLRFAREQALERARMARRQTETAVSPSATVLRGGAASVLGGIPSFWFRLASALPMLVLAVGLVGIGLEQDQVQIDAAADIDAALLADDLPPEAYADPGFQAFLKSGKRL